MLAVVLTVTILAVTAFFVPAALAIWNAQQRGELLALQREASIAASRVPPAGDPLRNGALVPVDGSAHRLALYRPDGALAAGDGPSRPDPVVATALTGDFAEGYVDGDLVAAAPVRRQPDGSAYVVRIDAPRGESRNRFLGSLAELAGAGVAVVAVAGLLGVRLTRRLNQPIEDLRAWAGAADLAGPSPAPLPPPPPTGIAELDGLRRALVGSRNRIAELLSRERSFSSQVSHQLLTPVAAMRVAIETERAAPRTDHNAILDESLAQLDRLQSTITSMLALARHVYRPALPVDLAALAAERASVFTALAADRGRELEVVGAPTPVVGDADAIGHIVDVLVHNALRHGQGRVTVRVGARADGSADTVAAVDVADEGRTPTERDPFAERGADTSHGIGLRLARSLAEAAQGRLELLDGPTTVFRLTVPVNAALVDPAPAGPAPVGPAPAGPALVDKAPAGPAPVDKATF